MELKRNINKKKKLYSVFLEFIETPDDSEIKFQDLLNFIEVEEILDNKEMIHIIFSILSQISANHCRSNDFITRIEKIISYLIKESQENISDSDINQIYRDNKRILFYLFENQLIEPDNSIICSYNSIITYLYPVVKNKLSKYKKETVEK